MINYNKTHTFSFRVPMIIILITIGTLTINAQNQITGTLYNEYKPIPYATITVNTDSISSSTIKGYAITDDEGNFSIKADIRTNDWLIVRCLGYKDLKKQVVSISDNFNLQMEEDILSINEITIKANYSGIKFSNDTVIFDTKNYSTGTEENIGDILKKIPGIEVNKTGKVSYTGRNIGKILIDGKDIISSSNNLAINNLSADLMESAEVLMNYDNKSITNSFKNDETLALNIKTSKAKKLNGYIQGCGGYKNTYQAKSNLLYIGEKSSFSAILSSNNIGDAVFSIEDYISNIVGIENLLSQNKNTYTLSNEEAKMLLPPSNVNEHTNGALSINTTYVPSEDFNFKGNIIYNGSFLKANSYSEDQYFSGNITNKKDESNKDKNHYITTSLQETWKTKENFELNASTRFSVGKYDTEQFLNNKIINKDISSNNNNNLLSTQFVQDLNTNSSIGNGIFYSYIHIEAENRKNDYSMLSDSILLPIQHSLMQEKELPYTFLNNTTNKKISVSPEIGYVFPFFKGININTSLSYYYSKERLTYSEKKTNTDVSKLNKYQANIRFEKNKGLFRFGLGANFSINNYSGSVFNNTDTKYFISPELSVQLVFSSKHRLNLSAIHDTKPTEIGFLSKQHRITGYNEILNGSTIKNMFNNETNISMNYNIFDLYTNTTFFLFASYINKKNLPMPCISQENIVSTTTYKDGGNQNIYMAKSYLNKGLSFIPVDTKLTCSYSQTEYNILLNGSENQIKSQSITTGLSFSSRFKAAFNAELDANYQYSNSSTSNTNIKNDIHEWSTTAKLHYSYKKISAYVYGTFLSIDNPYYKQSNVDIGFSCEYQIKNIGIKLLGKNLLHLKDMEWIGIYNTPYFTSTSLYQKIPGYLQCSLSYHF